MLMVIAWLNCASTCANCTFTIKCHCFSSCLNARGTVGQFLYFFSFLFFSFILLWYAYALMNCAHLQTSAKHSSLTSAFATKKNSNISNHKNNDNHNNRNNLSLAIQFYSSS